MQRWHGAKALIVDSDCTHCGSMLTYMHETEQSWVSELASLRQDVYK